MLLEKNKKVCTLLTYVVGEIKPKISSAVDVLLIHEKGRSKKRVL
jgi:hypothetical protein